MELKPLLTRRQAAVLLGISHRTLEKWTIIGGGPVYIRVGRKIMYHPGAIENYINEHQYINTHCRLDALKAS